MADEMAESIYSATESALLDAGSARVRPLMMCAPFSLRTVGSRRTKAHVQHCSIRGAAMRDMGPRGVHLGFTQVTGVIVHGDLGGGGYSKARRRKARVV